MTLSLPQIQMLDPKPAKSPIPWGYNGLGEIVYLRTYARDLNDEGLKEHWDQTIERVIRGTREINSRLTSSEEDRLADHMHNLRGSVSGRSLWMLGTSMVGRAGQDSLNNCYFSKIEQASDFSWIMARLMVGGGVGFSIERADVYQMPTIHKATVTHIRANDTDFVVPDTREGWTGLLERTIDAHFTGRGFTYSTILVREAGVPLKNFGGTSSGPHALIDGMKDICKVMCARHGKRLRSIDAMDIANIIGRIVVAGSARRSAEIALGDPDDALFLRAKRWADGNVPAWRQNSNNTIIVDKYSQIADDAAFWRNFDGGSEPYGLFNRRLSQTVGRTGEKRLDKSITGGNPCFAADTRILTKNGWRTFTELAGTDPLIVQDRRVQGSLNTDGSESFEVDPVENGVIINQAHNVRITARERQLWRLRTSDGRVVRATDDHHFATPAGMKMLRDLAPDDEILVAMPDPHIADKESQDWKPGYLLGLIASDGHLSADQSQAAIALWDTAGMIEDEAARIEELVTTVIAQAVATEPALARSGGSRPVQLTPHFANGTSTSEGKMAVKRLYSRVLWNIMFERQWGKKNIDWLHHCSLDFKAGFVSGLFYGDGSVQDSKGSINWRLAQSDRPFLSNVQLVLQELGVRSTLVPRANKGETMLPDGHGGRRLYPTRPNFELIISGRRQCDRAAIVLEIPAHHRSRWDALMGRYSKSAYRDPDVTRVASIEIDAIEDVWCLSENSRRTLVAEGLTARRCLEIGLANKESCNLATIWLPNVRTFDEFRDLSGILLKIQKATALLPHPSPESNAIIHKNLRLGQSVAGILQATSEQRDWLSPGYEALRSLDAEWSKKLGVRQSVRLTTVQPNGTMGLLGGSTPGIHPAYDRFYIRRVRFGVGDPLIESCRAKGYPVVEEIGLDGRVDRSRMVVEFPCEAPEGTPLNSTTSAVDQLDWASWAQREWSDNGVSVTVTFRPEEMPAIKSWMAEHYDNEVKSVSFLPFSEHGFALAPYEPIDEAEYTKRVGKVKAKEITLVGETTLTDDECEGGACPVR